jgi:hypothetical protein
MRVSFLQGLQEDYFEARYDSVTAATGGNAQVGIGYNATNAFSGKIGHWSVASGASQLYGSHRVQQLGWGFMQACEQSDGSFVHTFYGDNGGALQTGLDYQGRF